MGIANPLLPYFAALAALAVIVLYYVLRRRTRKKTTATLVVCQPNQITAQLELDEANQIVGCSRLPRGHRCDQVCHAQASYSPVDLDRFMQMTSGKSCQRCGTAITGEDWYKSRSAQGCAATTAFVPVEVGSLCWDCFIGRA